MMSPIMIVVATQICLAISITMGLYWNRSRTIGFSSGREEELLQTLVRGLEDIEWRMEKLESSTSNSMVELARRN